VDVQITAPANFQGQLKKITVEFSPFQSEVRCFEYDARSADMSGEKATLASTNINEQSYPQLFGALSALESWRSYFYFNYFFSWDKITKSGWRDLARTGHKDGSLGRDNQRFYNLYQMMVAILAAETGIDLSVPDNPYTFTVFEWNVTPGGDAYDEPLNLKYGVHTTVEDLKKRLYKKLPSDCSITLLYTDRVLRDDELVPNLKSGSADYVLEINKTMFESNNVSDDAIVMRYINPRELWLDKKNIETIQVHVTRAIVNQKDGVRIVVKAKEKLGGELHLDPLYVDAQDMEYLYPAFIEHLTLIPQESVVDDEIWTERRFKISKDDLCDRFIELYAEKMGLALRRNFHSVVPPQQARWYQRSWFSKN
jgi:hypothetical protein